MFCESKQRMSNVLCVVAVTAKVLASNGFKTFGTEYSFNKSELFNPTTLTWRQTGSQSVARIQFQMVRLRDGRVLSAGGTNNIDNAAFASADVCTLSESLITSPDSQQFYAVQVPMCTSNESCLVSADLKRCILLHALCRCTILRLVSGHLHRPWPQRA